MKILFILFCTLISACAHKNFNPKELRNDEILVFGRFYDTNPEASPRKNYFTFQLDGQERKFMHPEFSRPNFEDEDNFFWITIPNNTKEFKVKSFHLTLEGRSGGISYYVNDDESMAISKISSSHSRAIYIGDFVVTSKSVEMKDDRPEALKKLTGVGKYIVLTDVKIQTSYALAKDYLIKKNFEDGNFAEAKLSIQSFKTRGKGAPSEHFQSILPKNIKQP